MAVDIRFNNGATSDTRPTRQRIDYIKRISDRAMERALSDDCVSKSVFPGLRWKEIESILESKVRICGGYRANYFIGWTTGDVDFY